MVTLSSCTEKSYTISFDSQGGSIVEPFLTSFSINKDLPIPEKEPIPQDLELEKYPLDQYQEPWFWHERKYQWVKLKIGLIKLPYVFLYEEMLIPPPKLEELN
jgi:hypothetical protein